MTRMRFRTLLQEILDGMTGPARVVFYTMIAILVFTALLASTALDPYVQPSAYPALVGDVETVRARTLADGHWLVWLWSARGTLTSPPALFFLFALSWLMASAIMAQAIFADDRLPWRGLIATLAFAAAPPVANLALAYPELVPLTALLAIYAVVCTLAKLLWAQSLLLIAVPLGMLCHPAAGLALFAILMVTPRQSGDGTSLMRGLMIYFASSALGMLVMLLLNKAAHNVFDVLRDSSERPSPAVDVESALANLDHLKNAMPGLGQALFGPVPLAAIALFALAIVAIYRVEPRRGDRLFGGFSVAFVILAIDVVRTGRLPEVGELLGLWIFFVGALAWAALFLTRLKLAKVAALTIVVTAAGGLVEWQTSQMNGGAYLRASKALADDIAAEIASVGNYSLSRRGTVPHVPNGPRGRAHTLGQPSVRRVLVSGSPSSLDGADVLTRFDGLAIRLEHLLDMPVIQCPTGDEDCTDKLSTIVQMPAHPQPGYISVRPTGDVLVRLQDGEFNPMPGR